MFVVMVSVSLRVSSYKTLVFHHSNPKIWQRDDFSILSMSESPQDFFRAPRNTVSFTP
jgi:hypothetical protein